VYALLVAVVALSLAILLLCFVTFIVFIVQLRLSTPNKVYDDDDAERKRKQSYDRITKCLPCYNVMLTATPIRRHALQTEVDYSVDMCCSTSNGRNSFKSVRNFIYDA